MAIRGDSARPDIRRYATGAAAVLVLVGSLVFLWTRVMAPSVADNANERVFVCVETGKSFKHALKVGEEEPIVSPFTGKNTAWRAEPCYWTKDGRAKKNPTWVVVRQHMGLEGKTLCPDCGREVRIHNEKPRKELMDAAE
jgi:hypothetical protein